MVSQALEAAEVLSKEGVSARVVNLHTIKPIDREAIVKCASETGAFVTAEEHQLAGGMGSAVLEVLATEHPVPVEMVGINDTFGESGDPSELLEAYGLSVNKLVKAAHNVLRRKK
jgi:transketolase